MSWDSRSRGAARCGDDSCQRFVGKVTSLPALPTDGSVGEFHHSTQSDWVGGIFRDGVIDPDVTVELVRVANNEPDYGERILDYTVTVHLGRKALPLDMPPQAAIELGRMLVAAGTGALRDECNQTGFVAPEPPRGVDSTLHTCCQGVGRHMADCSKAVAR
jgi:hypothetical protein